MFAMRRGLYHASLVVVLHCVLICECFDLCGIVSLRLLSLIPAYLDVLFVFPCFLCRVFHNLYVFFFCVLCSCSSVLMMDAFPGGEYSSSLRFRTRLFAALPSRRTLYPQASNTVFVTSVACGCVASYTIVWRSQAYKYAGLNACDTTRAI